MTPVAASDLSLDSARQETSSSWPTYSRWRLVRTSCTTPMAADAYTSDTCVFACAERPPPALRGGALPGYPPPGAAALAWVLALAGAEGMARMAGPMARCERPKTKSRVASTAGSCADRFSAATSKSDGGTSDVHVLRLRKRSGTASIAAPLARAPDGASSSPPPLPPLPPPPPLRFIS